MLPCVDMEADMETQHTVKRIPRTPPMSALSTAELLKEISRLQAELNECKSQYRAERKLNRDMAKRCRILPSVLHGQRGELLIADVSHGVLTNYAESFDILTPEKAKIEVKISFAHDRSDRTYRESRMSYTETYSWGWSNILGSENSPKKYDFLILIGVMPEKMWRDNVPELAFFFVHISQAKALSLKNGAIQLGLSPRQSSKAYPLLERKVTLAELESMIRKN